MKNGQTYTMQEYFITLNKMCTIRKETYSITISKEKYLDYFNGKELVQNLFSDLSIEQREFIISGWTPTEWNQMFKNLEE